WRAFWRDLPLVAVRDTLLALEWLAAVFGTHVVWRGARMTVVGGERAAAAVEGGDGR
ncbi:ceramide glucosyltransferase, partial [Burkholderia territorii]